MNYIEAIRELKAGKKIKLKSWIKGNYWRKGMNINQIISQSGDTENKIPATDFINLILSEDWEVIEDKQPLTFDEKNIIKIWAFAYMKTGDNNYYKQLNPTLYQMSIELAKQLEPIIENFFQNIDQST